jgi:hypothetical protein
MSGDKTSGDKTSVDKTSVGTKHWWGQNVRSDKTSVGQNVRGDKTSVGQNIRRTKHPWGQNVRGDKTSVDKTSVWVIFIRALLGNIFTDKNLLSVKEEKSANTHTLSLCGRVGGKHVQYLTSQRGPLYLSKNSLHLKIVIFSGGFL